MKWRKNRNIQDTHDAEINVTPLIDVALTLLIVFMVTTPMIKKEKGLHVQLPKGDIQEVPTTAKQEITICMDAKGAITLNNKVVKKEDLMNSLKLVAKQVNATAKRSDLATVFIKADQAMSYGAVIELVTQIKQCEGVGYVALPTTSTL